MRSLIFGAAASLALSVAVLAAPASAAPIPSANGAIATDSGITTVQMGMHDRMMMRHHMRERMMMRHHMRKRMMMHRMMRRDMHRM